MGLCGCVFGGQAYKSIARAVTRTTRRLFKHGKYDKLYVTGHSLGGAIAVLASAHLASELGQASVDMLERMCLLQSVMVPAATP